MGGNDDVLILDRPLGRHLERIGHGVHQVGFSDVPALQKGDSLRSIRGVAFPRTCIHPRHQSVPIGVRQAAVVGELPIVRVGEPRRHFLHLNLGLDRLGPGASAPVVQKRHGRHFPGTMAVLTIPLEHRQNIFVESGAWVGGSSRSNA